MISARGRRFAAGGARWVSFLVQQTSTVGGVSYAAATLGAGDVLGNAAAVATGLGDSSAFVNCFCLAQWNANVSTSIEGLLPGGLTLFLLRFDFAPSGNDTLRIWANPPLDAAVSLGTPAATAALVDHAERLNGLTLASGDNRLFSCGERRIGTSRSPVLPHTAP